PEATEKCHRGDWYVTGDRASMDDDGYLWFVGRADDVINSASYRIGPFEVESALVEHAAVAEAAVIGKPDTLRGEIVKAFVVLAPGHFASDALAGELQEHVKAVTAPYKYPREIEFVTDLPKTISGKIRRTELRDMERCLTGGVAFSVLVHTDMSSPWLVRFGTDAQKRKYLPGIARGETVCALGITEPGAGSDMAALTTRAERDGDVYRLTGSKIFITNGVYG